MDFHDYFSFTKSLIRIIGYGLLTFQFPWIGIVLIISELLGIAEEIPQLYKKIYQK